MTLGKRCLDCGTSISHRGKAAKRCEPCQKDHALEWRKDYDSHTDQVEKRRQYDNSEHGIKSARERRNKKTYLLELLFLASGFDKIPIDEAILSTQMKLIEKRIPFEWKYEGDTPGSNKPWKTNKGSKRKKRIANNVFIPNQSLQSAS